jgi:hypothetical protein
MTSLATSNREAISKSMADVLLAYRTELGDRVTELKAGGPIKTQKSGSDISEYEIQWSSS